MAMKKRRDLSRNFLAGHVVNVRWDKDREAVEFTVGQRKFLVSSDDPHKNQIRLGSHVLVVFEQVREEIKRIVKVIKNPTPTDIMKLSVGCID